MIPNLQLPFIVISTTSQSEEHPATNLNSDGSGLNYETNGWISSKNPHLPIEINIELTTFSEIHQMQFLMHNYKYPKKIDIYAEDSFSSLPNDYAYIGTIRTEEKLTEEQKNKRDIITANISCTTQHLKLEIDGCYKTPLNKHNRINICAISILGNPVDRLEYKIIPYDFDHDGHKAEGNVKIDKMSSVYLLQIEAYLTKHKEPDPNDDSNIEELSEEQIKKNKSSKKTANLIIMEGQKIRGLQKAIKQDPDNIYLKHDLDTSIEKRKEIVDAALPELHLRINGNGTISSSSSEEEEEEEEEEEVIQPPPSPPPPPPPQLTPEPEPQPEPESEKEPEPEPEPEDDGKDLYNSTVSDNGMVKEEDIPLAALDELIREWRINAHQSPPEGMTKEHIASFAKYAKVFGLYFIMYLNSQNCNLNSGCIEILQDNLNVISDKYTPVELYKYLYEIMLTPLKSPVPSLFQRAVIFCNDFFRNNVKYIDISKIDKNEVNKGINEVISIITDRVSDHNEEIRETSIHFLNKFIDIDNEHFEMEIAMILSVMKKEKENVDVENLCGRVKILSQLLEKKKDKELFHRKDIEEFVVKYCPTFDDEELLVLLSELFGKYYPSVADKTRKAKPKEKTDDKETPGDNNQDSNTVEHSKTCHLL